MPLPLALTLLELILIGALLALLLVAALSQFAKSAGGSKPPPPPPPPPYDQPLTDLLDLLKKINDENPSSVSTDDCRKLRALLEDAKDKGLPTTQADAVQGIVDKLCPQ